MMRTSMQVVLQSHRRGYFVDHKAWLYCCDFVVLEVVLAMDLLFLVDSKVNRPVQRGAPLGGVLRVEKQLVLREVINERLSARRAACPAAVLKYWNTKNEKQAAALATIEGLSLQSFCKREKTTRRIQPQPLTIIVDQYQDYVEDIAY
jgi:hypothetical protein